MKIPETSANVGAYYGNEENQWQPNGVIIDNGVGGGVVGSGDAGMHRAPVYPLHIPRAHVPAGYVMAGAYYGAPFGPHVPQPDDFADYMWMENEEEFDKQVLQQLEEEALMEQCIEAMLEDEQRERRANRGSRQDAPTTSNGVTAVSLQEAVSRSTLNPLAAEFVPIKMSQNAPVTVEKKESQTPQAGAAITKGESRTAIDANGALEEDSKPDASEEVKTEEAVSPPKDPPEVSAADVHPNSKQAKKERENKKQEPKKVIKSEPKKTKSPPVVVKSETKVQPKKKEVKPVKSESKVEEKIEEVTPPVTETTKPTTPTVEESPTTTLKPINYAAAARASKPKTKPTITNATTTNATTTEKATPRPTEPMSKEKTKSEKIEKKVSTKVNNVQRKNSAK